jgi:SPP1 gp7 family putative phage head morphogenesis protein
MAKRVRKVMGVHQSRSMTIARTETGFAFADGRHIAMKENGIKKQEWLTARDSNVRDSHKIDGQVRSIGRRFSNGLLRPLDPNGKAKDVINCRCTVVPVLDGDEE